MCDFCKGLELKFCNLEISLVGDSKFENGGKKL